MKKGYIVVPLSKEILNTRMWTRTKYEVRMFTKIVKAARKKGGWALPYYTSSTSNSFPVEMTMPNGQIETLDMEARNLTARRYVMVGFGT